MKEGFLTRVATSIDNTSFAFWWGIVGVFIQFLHLTLAVAGTLGVFTLDLHPVMIVLEGLLSVVIAGFISATLLHFTLMAGSIKPEKKNKEETKKLAKNKKNKYVSIVVLFAFFDILFAFYFWVFVVFMRADIVSVTTDQVITTMQENWIPLVFILALTVLLPITLMFYANEIDLKKFIKKGDSK
jgi:uncharacterized protein YqhQ